MAYLKEVATGSDDTHQHQDLHSSNGVEEKMTTSLVAFFMQPIKEMFCNILYCNFRIFKVFSLYGYT